MACGAALLLLRVRTAVSGINQLWERRCQQVCNISTTIGTSVRYADCSWLMSIPSLEGVGLVITMTRSCRSIASHGVDWRKGKAGSRMRRFAVFVRGKFLRRATKN